MKLRETESILVDKITTKTVCKKDMCTGCFACAEVCPKHAIHISDATNAYNAVINNDLCVNCNTCYKICQINNPFELKEPQKWYQGWANDVRIRSIGASGGVATSLSNMFIDRGGIVCSCIFNEGKFGFSFAESHDELNKMAGSKYVKSNPMAIYKELRTKLSYGQEVLFIGLPCQVAAIKRFVGDELQESLFTIDLICHGTPSPQLLESFLNQYGYSLEKIRSIRFRDKDNFRIHELETNKDVYTYIEPKGIKDCYTIAFLEGLFYTENCYHCPYACSKRISDITLGDSWGSNLDIEEQNKGLSLILCQTDKGKALIDKSNLHLEEVDFNIAVSNNRQLVSPSKTPAQRINFMKSFKAGKKFNRLVMRYLPDQYFKQKLKKILFKLHIRMGGGNVVVYGISIND